MKYWDIKPVCSNILHHHQIRRFTRTLESPIIAQDGYAYALIMPTADPCRWYISREQFVGNTELFGRFLRTVNLLRMKRYIH